MSDTIRSEVGKYAFVPLWIINADVSDRALRLYALLHAEWANKDTRVAFPSKKTLSERLRCAKSTVELAVKELADVGALVVSPRRREDGSQTSNDYYLKQTPPDPSGGGARQAGRGEPDGSGGGEPDGSGAMNQNQFEPESLNTTTGPPIAPLTLLDEPVVERDPWAGQKVSRKEITQGELEMARSILDAFNAKAKTTYGSWDFARGIIMRLREHPSLTLSDHLEIMDRNFANPWWKDTPAPSVIYGKPTLFEQAMQQKGGTTKSDFDAIANADLDALRRRVG